MAAPVPARHRRHRAHSPMGVPLTRAVVVLVMVVAAVCGGTAPTSGAPRTPSDPSWRWPLGGAGQPAPRVVRPFAPPRERWLAGHRGVDLAGTVGQPVHSPAAGEVTYASRLAGRGVVVVRIGDRRTTLEPVDAVVDVGDRVRAGQLLGHLSVAGSHCLPAACLHWGLLRGDTYLEPLPEVGSADVVLLPLSRPPPVHPGAAAFPAGLAAALDTGPPSGSAADAIAFARQQLGEPYVWAAAGPHTWDCSGLTMAAWAAAGRSLPHHSASQYAASTPIAESDLRPGDLVFWAALPGSPRTIFHVGLYLGGGQMVHAPRPGTVVRVESIYSWARPSFFARP